jgi:hypothetical protein
MCLNANVTLEREVSTDHLPAGTTLTPLAPSITDIHRLPDRVTMLDMQPRPCAEQAHR